MLRGKKIVFSFGFLLTGLAIAQAAEPPPELLREVNGTYICGFKDGIGPASAPGLVENLKAQGLTGVRHVYKSAFSGFSTRMAAKAIEQLMLNNSAIAFCEPNGLGQAGGRSANGGAQGGKKGKPPAEPVTQITPWGVTRVGGPGDATEKKGKIWIIDSGISDHADLKIDYASGKNFLTKGKKTLEDSSGHGTHIAGSAAAINNGIGVVGVAAGATVVPIKVMHTSYWATIDDMVAGIDYVAGEVAKNDGEAAKNGDVANMSIWAWGHSDSLHIASEGLADLIPFIVISGNDGEDINDRSAEPAHVEHDNLITVSAIDLKDKFADFSNFGALDSAFCDGSPYCGQVDAAAPGVGIISLQPDGSLEEWYGTSMAAPHIAGIVLMNGGAAVFGSAAAINDPDSSADPIYELKPLD